MRKTGFLLVSFALAAAFICPVQSPLAGPQATADSLSPAANVNDDGPHIYWENDTSAVVFYLCDGEFIDKRYRVTDSLRFNGLCRDSGLEYTISAQPPEPAPPVFDNIPQIFAVSDIHGDYEYFVDILQKGGVIDRNLDWTWGDNHLVILGDVFDRSDRVTESLWLIYRLEQQAPLNGGRVHFVLGNHELMVLRGDNRYIHEKYLDGIVKKTRIRHEDLYGPETELGRWLRTRPVAVRINEVLFVHAGISPSVIDQNMSLHDLNEAVRGYLDISSARYAFADTARLLFGSMGPLWYRGYFEGDSRGRYLQATSDDVNNVLKFYAANVIVVGHTENDHVFGLYDDKIIAIDVPAEELNGFEALLWREGHLYRVTVSGEPVPLE